jgi:signal recognition particle subunit SRP54
LVEQVQRQVDAQQMERLASKVKRGQDLGLDDFRDQLKQLVNMGGLEQLLDKLPGVKPEALAAARFDPRTLKRQIGIIDSMTPRERTHPAIIDGSRKRRIAAGAGLPIQEVSRLLKQHRQIGKTMKRITKGGGMHKMLGDAMRRGGQGPRGRR